MKVRDLMTTRVETLEPDDDLDLANALMRLERSRHLPVLANGDLIGLVSDRDILRAQVSSLARMSEEELRCSNMRIKVSEVMTHDVETIGPDVPAREAARRMRLRKIGCLPVVENGCLVGIVTVSDFLDAAIEALD